MFEEKRIKRVLIRNTALFFMVFAVLFTLLGIFVYQVVSSNIFHSADQQLNSVIIGASISINDETNDTEPQIDDAESFIIDPSSLEDEAFDSGIYESGPDTFSYSAEATPLEPDELIEENIENNPQIIFLMRDAQGELFALAGVYATYPAYIEAVPFDSTLINEVYPAEVEGHQYRAINRQLNEADGTFNYLQAIINVDSEISILEQFTGTLVIGLVAALIACAAASYLLSKKMIGPLVDTWKKQTEFVQNASHELRTPLTVIRTTQEFLLESPQEKIIDHFEDISQTIDETDRLKRLAEGLLSLSATDSGGVRLEREEFDLNQDVMNILPLYKEHGIKQGKALSLLSSEETLVLADRNQIRQVLCALLDNAFKYTKTGGSITVEVIPQSSTVLLRIADTGIGISDENLERVFDRFYRADKARTRTEDGFGLGLSIVRNIIDLHGGSVNIEPNSPKGTIVSITLPQK